MAYARGNTFGFVSANRGGFRSMEPSGLFDSLSTLESGNRNLAVLDEIYKKKCQINQDDEKCSKRVMKLFVDKLIDRLKSVDPLFKELYTQVYYTGSSFEGLRIRDPYEYDINLILKFPFDEGSLRVDQTSLDRFSRTPHDWMNVKISKYASFQLESRERRSCYSEIRYTSSSLTDQANNDSLQQRLLQKFFVNDHLSAINIRSWLQSIIDKAQVHEFQIKNVHKIKLTSSGPARTFVLVCEWNGRVKEISFDFVPVLEANNLCSRLVAGYTNFNRIPGNKHWFFLVPKPYTPDRSDYMTSSEAHFLWRIHFPQMEKMQIHDVTPNSCVKPVIKFMKLIRDKQNWKFLASYNLKIIVLNEIQINTANNNLILWHCIHMDERLLQVLKKLRDYLWQGKIPHPLFPILNMVEGENAQLLQSTVNRLNYMIKMIESDFSSLKDFV